MKRDFHPNASKKVHFDVFKWAVSGKDKTGPQKLVAVNSAQNEYCISVSSMPCTEDCVK